MNSPMRRIVSTETPATANLDQRMSGFAQELTELGRKYNIGVEGGTLYAMEQDDHAFAYRADEESRLIRV